MSIFDDVSTPRGRHWAGPAGLGVAAGVLALVAESDAWALGWAGLACVCGAWAVVNFWLHLRYAFGMRAQWEKELDFKLSENFRLEMVSKLNDDQLKVFHAGRHMVTVAPSETGPIEMLAGADVYLYMAWYILVRSNDERVYPINNFKVETFHFDVAQDHLVDDYRQAKNFHTWLVRMGYAQWGKGNQSASWVGEVKPGVLLGQLGLRRDSYPLPDGG